MSAGISLSAITLDFEEPPCDASLSVLEAYITDEVMEVQSFLHKLDLTGFVCVVHSLAPASTKNVPSTKS